MTPSIHSRRGSVSPALLLFGVACLAQITQIISAEAVIGLALICLLLLALIVLRITVERPNQRQSRPSMARYVNFGEEESPEVQVTQPYNSSTGLPVSRKRISTTIPRHPFETTQPIAPSSDTIVFTEDEALEKERTDAVGAARMWERLGRWSDAARCYLKALDFERTARIYLALGKRKEALPFLRQGLQSAPDNLRIRQELVETLIDLGQVDEALEIVNAVREDETAAQKINPLFFERIARNLEALDLIPQAKEVYQYVLSRDESLPEIHQRLQYMRHFSRLSVAVSREIDSQDGPGRLLEKYTHDTNTMNLAPSDHESPRGISPDLAGSEVIIGHLALGFLQDEPKFSISSYYSPSRRFYFESLIAETPKSAVFKAIDRLLDFPVAIKLYRLPPDIQGMDALRDRLLAVSRLNHPNLAKVVFADRHGRVIRVATEYLPGGNLKDFLEKLGGAGVPLIIRMAIQVASALHRAHSQGVPHADLRPENMIIGPDQRMKIVDFALSPIPVVMARHSPDSTESPVVPDREMNALFREGLRSDILQFGEVLEFMLERARKSSDPLKGQNYSDTTDQLRELISGIRGDQPQSMLDIWQNLQEIFEGTMPSGGTPAGGKPRLNI